MSSKSLRGSAVDSQVDDFAPNTFVKVCEPSRDAISFQHVILMLPKRDRPVDAIVRKGNPTLYKSPSYHRMTA